MEAAAPLMAVEASFQPVICPIWVRAARSSRPVKELDKGRSRSTSICRSSGLACGCDGGFPDVSAAEARLPMAAAAAEAAVAACGCSRLAPCSRHLPKTARFSPLPSAAIKERLLSLNHASSLMRSLLGFESWHPSAIQMRAHVAASFSVPGFHLRSVLDRLCSCWKAKGKVMARLQTRHSQIWLCLGWWWWWWLWW